MSKRILFSLTILIFMVFLGGCTLASYVEVTNNTGGPVYVTASAASPADKQTLETGETLVLTVSSGADNLSLDVYGMYKLSETKSVPLSFGSTTPLSLGADAGAIIVSNESVFYLTGVYLTSSDSDSWGDNLFTASDYISPDEAYYWTVSPGYWDVYVTNGTYYWDDYYNYIGAGVKATFNVGTLSNWWSGSESFDKSNSPEKPVEYIVPER